MSLVNNILLALFGLTILWLVSGYDAQVKGENKVSDYFRRITRCVVTLILLAMLFELPSVPTIMIVPISVGLIWRSCLSELGARWFHRLIDSDDRREFDPKKSARDLETVANLLKNGRNEEALQLCQTLKESGEGNILVLEALLARHGIQFDTGRKANPLAEASALRLTGKFGEAETLLNSLLAKNPANLDAALMLMRLYVEDLHRSDKASEVLRSLEKQPHVAVAHIEYARRSIHEWAQPKAAPQRVILPESVDELLVCGYFGTAIEILEKKIKEQPEDFDSWLKLAEAHGLHSGNHQRAGKIIQQIEAGCRFSSEQIELAKTKLNEWREMKSKPVEV